MITLCEDRSGSKNDKVSRVVHAVEQGALDPRAAMLDHLKRYAELPDWSLADTKERIAPYILGRLYRSGRSAAEEIRHWTSRRELDSCHAAQELLLLGMILDRLVKSDADIINSEAVEILTRRVHGLQLAFRDVKKLSDWKQPRGQGGQKWRSKVQWHLCDQYDIRALDEEDMAVPGVDEEVRRRLEHKALMNKYMAKAEEIETKGKKEE